MKKIINFPRLLPAVIAGVVMMAVGDSSASAQATYEYIARKHHFQKSSGVQRGRAGGIRERRLLENTIQCPEIPAKALRRPCRGEM